MKDISFRNDVLPLKNQLYRLALHITLNATEAEDVVQETLIRVWNKREDWAVIDSIEAFSFIICRNIALDSIRKHDNNNSSLDSTPIERADQSSNPFEQTAQSDSIEQVKRIVESLPEKQRSCMQLRDFEGKPYKEISEVLGISEEQVKVNIFRARQTVKERFNQLNSYGL